MIDGTLSADTSGVDGSVAGTYAATITGTDAFGFTSAPLTLNVVIYLASQKVGTVSIDGTPAVGSTLTASPAGWEDLSAPEYQWLRDGQPIAGATEAAYVVVTADAGRSLSVKMTEAPAWYVPATATSAAVAVPAIKAGREGTGTGSGSGTTPTPTPTPTPGPSKGAPKVSVTNHNRSAKVTVDCAATARVCIGTVTVTTAAKSPLKVGKTKRREYRTLGRAKFRVKGGQTKSLLVARNKRGKRLLALSTRPLKVRAVVASRAGDASARRTVVITLAPGK